CTARHPRCDTCVLSDLCPSAAILGPTLPGSTSSGAASGRS
ncbi:hypothetical protein ACS0QO_07810, partial [Deinococcus aquaticus]